MMSASLLGQPTSPSHCDLQPFFAWLALWSSFCLSFIFLVVISTSLERESFISPGHSLAIHVLCRLAASLFIYLWLACLSRDNGATVCLYSILASGINRALISVF